MKAYLLLAAAALAGISCFAFAAPDDGRNAPPEPQLIELSGRLRRPPKWTPQLELIPAGQVNRLDLRGNLLEGIPDGTPLRVRGVVRSQLHRGGSAENPSPFPAQWILWLDVTHVERLADPLDVLQGGNR